MFSIFKKSSREEAFQPTWVSLIYPQQLKAELAPFVQGSGAKQSLLTGEARDEALGEIVRRYIPEPTMHALKSMAMGTEKTPVVIENLPTEPETVAQAGRHKHRVPPEELYSSAIARGLYRAVGISPVRDTVLRRPDPQAIIHGLAMHRDEKDFSILTCATNRDRAPTVFIDLKAVMEGMSRKERIAMRVKEVTSGPYEVTLQDVYDITQRQGYGGFTELTVLNPSPK
ncbi:MAG: hypothetical protein EBV03_11480, partial [Proteobacteria bacterium]|nr:hypothetical protein [Pseudomonadota bacterium]